MTVRCCHVTCWQCEDARVAELKRIIEGLLAITPDTRNDEPAVQAAIDALDK